MICEGVGVVAPSPVRFKVSDETLLKYLKEAQKRVADKKYESRGDKWGRGMLGPADYMWANQTVPGAIRGTLIGTVGEHAIGECIASRVEGVNPQIDFRLLPNGDGGKDFVVCGLSIQVKCRRAKPRKSVSEVRIATAAGRKLKLAATAWVFTEWDEANEVKVLGFVYRNRLKEMPIDTSRYGHENYLIADTALDPIGRLADDIYSRKQLEELGC